MKDIRFEEIVENYVLALDAMEADKELPASWAAISERAATFDPDSRYHTMRAVAAFTIDKVRRQPRTHLYPYTVASLLAETEVMRRRVGLATTPSIDPGGPMLYFLYPSKPDSDER